jgi:hypothetical protein
MQLTSMDISSLIHFKVITFDLFYYFNLLLVCVINPFCYVVKVSSTLWTQAILIGQVTLHLTKVQKYHLPKFRQGPMPRGKKELFNYTHSSLRNVIERSFGILKMKWRILLQFPGYPMPKQSQIIIACMTLCQMMTSICVTKMRTTCHSLEHLLHSLVQVLHVKGKKMKI